MIFADKVTPEFAKRAREVAQALRLNVDYLMAVICFETAGTFSPSVKNPRSSATGLIQFTERTAEALGTTTEKLAAMDAVTQLGYVEKFLKPYAGRMKSLADAYMAVLYPIAVGLPDWAVIFLPGSRNYLANKGLDIDHDGEVTKGEAAERVRRILAQATTKGDQV